jgi:hypothetical protein
MFILHVKHYFFQEILKVHSCKKRCRVSILSRLLPANYKIFEVPVLVFARASGNAVSAVRPWDRGWFHPRPQAQARAALTVALVQAVEQLIVIGSFALCTYQCKPRGGGGGAGTREGI